jgi:putative flippase GtrA
MVMTLVTDAPAGMPTAGAPVASGGEARQALVVRVFRCMGVSVITTIVSLTVLLVTTYRLGFPAWIGNVTATSLATVPSYHLNRRWTWGRRDPSDPWREIVPFWTLAFAGLALSTVAVAVTASFAAGAHLAAGPRAVVLVAAHLSGFGALWIVQFVLLERVLFGRRADEASIGT